MDALEAIKLRRSVRNFKKGTIIDKKDILTILDAGRLAATARNIQPWYFIVVLDKDKLKILSEIVGRNGRYIADANCCIVVVCEDTKYYLEDGCAATQNMLITARALGIGSVWIAGDKKDYCDKVLSFLKVPFGYKLVSLIAFGYPESDKWPEVEKKSLDELYFVDEFKGGKLN